MIFDGIIVVILILAGMKGYKRGLVSTILALVFYAVAFFMTIQINKQIIFVQTPIGIWMQGIIIFFLLNLVAKLLIKFIDFESFLFVGFISKILGAIANGIIISAVVVFCLYLAVTFGAKEFLETNVIFENSLIVEWVTTNAENIIVQNMNRFLE